MRGVTRVLTARWRKVCKPAVWASAGGADERARNRQPPNDLPNCADGMQLTPCSSPGGRCGSSNGGSSCGGSGSGGSSCKGCGSGGGGQACGGGTALCPPPVHVVFVADLDRQMLRLTRLSHTQIAGNTTTYAVPAGVPPLSPLPPGGNLFSEQMRAALLFGLFLPEC